MSNNLIRSRLLNAVYKNKTPVISAMATELSPLLVGEALSVSCDYCHPECTKILLGLPHAADIGDLIYTTMCSDNIAQQHDMLEILLPVLPTDECEWVARLACESLWRGDFSSIFQRLPEDVSDSLNMEWAATQGDIEALQGLMDEDNISQLNRLLIVASVAGQWDVCRFLVPLCDHFSVLCDLNEEQHHNYGRYSHTISRLEEIVDEYKCQQQNDVLMESVGVHQSKGFARKI